MSECMTVAEVMEATGKGQDTIYRLMRKGVLVKTEGKPREGGGKPITLVTTESVNNYIFSKKH